MFDGIFDIGVFDRQIVDRLNRVDHCTMVFPAMQQADAFERIRALFDDEPFDVREAYPAIDEITGKAGWDDPAMDVYNNYDTDKPKS